MITIKTLWKKWWFFIPVSFVMVALIIGLIGLFIGVNPRNVGRLTSLVWILLILERYWWGRKKK